MQLTDTIVSISTPPGRGGIGIVRLSGRDAKVIATTILRLKRHSEWASWTATLAELPDDALAALYPAEQLTQLHKDLAGIRAAGFALNVEQTEEGLAAFAVAVHNRAGRAIAAVSVAVPAVRYRRHAQGDLIPTLKRAVRELELDVADVDPH